MPRIPGYVVAQVAHRAGFSGVDRATGRSRLIMAVAIAAAESGWNTSAHALTSREDSRGLWQINVRAHPWGRAIDLYDAQVNANAAERVYSEAGQSFRPWSVYLHGTYLQYWAQATEATRGLDPGLARAAAAANPPGVGLAHRAYLDVNARRFGDVGRYLQGATRRISDVTRS